MGWLPKRDEKKKKNKKKRARAHVEIFFVRLNALPQRRDTPLNIVRFKTTAKRYYLSVEISKSGIVATISRVTCVVQK